jgi:zinc transport system substrate-binding protein
MVRTWLLVTSLVLLVGCSSTSEQPSGSESSKARPATVVATFYPLAWMTEQIGGADVAVTNLTPPGVEPHDLELAADQVELLEKADLAIVLGQQFQPGPEKVAARRSLPTITVLKKNEANDPHIWLDPVRFSDVRKEIVAQLVQLRPDEATQFETRSTALGQALAALDADFREGLRSCRRRLVVSTHEAFGRLASRYGLKQEGIAGLAPDVEPDPQRLADLADLVRSTGTTTVFTEELAPADFAATLARETGVVTKVLSPLEGLTNAQTTVDASYLTVMRDNLAALKGALDCP